MNKNVLKASVGDVVYIDGKKLLSSSRSDPWGRDDSYNAFVSGFYLIKGINRHTGSGYMIFNKACWKYDGLSAAFNDNILVMNPTFYKNSGFDIIK